MEEHAARWAWTYLDFNLQPLWFEGREGGRGQLHNLLCKVMSHGVFGRVLAWRILRRKDLWTDLYKFLLVSLTLRVRNPPIRTVTSVGDCVCH